LLILITQATLTVITQNKGSELYLTRQLIFGRLPQRVHGSPCSFAIWTLYVLKSNS